MTEILLLNKEKNYLTEIVVVKDFETKLLPSSSKENALWLYCNVTKRGNFHVSFVAFICTKGFFFFINGLFLNNFVVDYFVAYFLYCKLNFIKDVHSRFTILKHHFSRKYMHSKIKVIKIVRFFWTGICNFTICLYCEI